MGRYTPKKKIRPWRQKDPPYEVEKDGFTIYDLPKSEAGWVDAELYRPLRFELVKAKTKEKVKYVWWDGNDWDGYRLRQTDQIIEWNTIHSKKEEINEEW